MLRPLTLARFKNFEDEYSGVWPVIHLKAIVALDNITGLPQVHVAN